MQQFIENDNHVMREQMKAIFDDPVFRDRYNISLKEERDIAYERLKRICAKKLFSVRDFYDNPLRIFAAHEVAGMCDGSMATKMTVQFNLFGGTVLKLGTEKHHDVLCDGIDSLKDMGCFALTELGFGNNAIRCRPPQLTMTQKGSSSSTALLNYPRSFGSRIVPCMLYGRLFLRKRM